MQSFRSIAAATWTFSQGTPWRSSLLVEVAVAGNLDRRFWQDAGLVGDDLEEALMNGKLPVSVDGGDSRQGARMARPVHSINR